MENGKPKFFEVADPLLFSAYTSMPRVLNNGGILRFFKFWRRLGQRTITWSIDFAIRNVSRDQLMAGTLSENGFRPFIDAARGMKSRLTQDVNDQRLNELFIRECIVGWKNIEEDGESFPFSPENAILLDQHWPEFNALWNSVIEDLSTIAEEVQESELGNFESGEGST